MQIFISHSKNDPNLDFFKTIFATTNIRSIWMEFEDVSSPPWKTINKMGLNITNLKKKTKLSHTSMTKALSSLLTAEIIDMEEVGNSKVYHLKGGK